MTVLAPEHTLETPIEAEGGWVDDEDDEIEGELGQSKKTDKVFVLFISKNM